MHVMIIDPATSSSHVLKYLGQSHITSSPPLHGVSCPL